jgi:hypothetical protein
MNVINHEVSPGRSASAFGEIETSPFRRPLGFIAKLAIGNPRGKHRLE